MANSRPFTGHPLLTGELPDGGAAQVFHSALEGWGACPWSAPMPAGRGPDTGAGAGAAAQGATPRQAAARGGHSPPCGIGAAVGTDGHLVHPWLANEGGRA